MKTLKEYLTENCESCNMEDYDMLAHHKHMKNRETGELEEGEVESEDDFRQYAENKFKTVFGDELDTDRMNSTIDGLLSDNKDLVDKGEWGELVGMLNKSFGS